MNCGPAAIPFGYEGGSAPGAFCITAGIFVAKYLNQGACRPGLFVTRLASSSHATKSDTLRRKVCPSHFHDVSSPLHYCQ
jgi:hypothetical protein